MIGRNLEGEHPRLGQLRQQMVEKRDVVIQPVKTGIGQHEIHRLRSGPRTPGETAARPRSRLFRLSSLTPYSTPLFSEAIFSTAASPASRWT